MTVTSEARVFFHPRRSCSAQLLASEYLVNAETSVSDGRSISAQSIYWLLEC
jgi:hypothetical protein